MAQNIGMEKMIADAAINRRIVGTLSACCIKIGTAEAENLYAALAIRKRFVQLYFTTALLRKMFHFSCNRRKIF